MPKRRPTSLIRVELPTPSGLKLGLTRRLGGWGWSQAQVELRKDAEVRNPCGRMGRKELKMQS